MPDSWYKNAVFYEVFVRAFYDSNGDGHGDLPGLTEKLDYLQYLGVDCLWLMPIYPSPLKDDGYDISDFYSVYPKYGTLEDSRALVQIAHARGLKVITDLVLNHTSDQHPWFQAARSAATRCTETTTCGVIPIINTRGPASSSWIQRSPIGPGTKKLANTTGTVFTLRSPI